MSISSMIWTFCSLQFFASVFAVPMQRNENTERLIITLGKSNTETLIPAQKHRGCQALNLKEIPCSVDVAEVFLRGRFCTSSDSVILEKSTRKKVTSALGCITNYLQQDPESVELDAEISISADFYAKQWHLPAISAYGSPGSNAWDFTRGNNEIIVAVIDTGVDYHHPDLRANIWQNPSEVPGNGIDDDGNGFVDDVFGYDFHNEDGDPMDDNGHGTHCAGVVGGVANIKKRVSGVSPHVRVMAIKAVGAQGDGLLSDIIAAVEYSLEMGAQITSNSFGTPKVTFSPAFNRLVKVMEQAGQLYVAAAGNAGRNNDLKPEFPASLSSDIILAVAATTERDKLASFSNYGGKTVDLGAPGVRILSTNLDDGYGRAQGTSTATPLVAATAALVLSTLQQRGISLEGMGAQVKEILLASVDQIPALQNVTVSGGRLNAAKAVQLASSLAMNDKEDIETVDLNTKDFDHNNKHVDLNTKDVDHNNKHDDLNTRDVDHNTKHIDQDSSVSRPVGSWLIGIVFAFLKLIL